MPEQKRVPDTEKGSDRGLRSKQDAANAEREQKVVVEHGTPGGGLGTPDEKDLKTNPESTAEKGGNL